MAYKYLYPDHKPEILPGKYEKPFFGPCSTRQGHDASPANKPAGSKHAFSIFWILVALTGHQGDSRQNPLRQLQSPLRGNLWNSTSADTSGSIYPAQWLP